MKLREPHSIEDALTIICAGIGYSDAAKAVERSEQHVRRWGDPDDDSLPNIKQAMALDFRCYHVTGKAPLYDAYGKWLARAKTNATPEPMRITDVMLSATAQLGDVARLVRDALADNRISESERNEILRSIANGRGAYDALETAVYTAHASQGIGTSRQ